MEVDNCKLINTLYILYSIPYTHNSADEHKLEDYSIQPGSTIMMIL